MRVSTKLLALAGAGALALAACGGGGGDTASTVEPAPDAPTLEGSSEPLAVLAAAPDRLADASTARLEMHMTTSGLGVPFEVVAQGAFDFTTGDGSMTMDMTGLGVPAEVGTIEIRVVDGVVYMDAGALGDLGDLGGLDGFGRWMKIDPTALAAELGLDPADLGVGTESMDLTSTFDMLRDISGEVTELGREEVRGTQTTRYRVLVDVEAALEQGLTQLPDELGVALDPAEIAASLPAIPIEVWVDDTGLVHRMEMHMAMADLAPDSGLDSDAEVVMVIDVSDFGLEVDVVAPPESETFDLLGLLAGMVDDTGALAIS